MGFIAKDKAGANAMSEMLTKRLEMAASTLNKDGDEFNCVATIREAKAEIERLTAEIERNQSSAEMFADIVKTMDEVATPWMRDDGEGGLTGTIRRMAAALEQAKAMPDGWRLVEKPTCYQLAHGNEIVATLAGPDAEENAAVIARLLDQANGDRRISSKMADDLGKICELVGVDPHSNAVAAVQAFVEAKAAPVAVPDRARNIVEAVCSEVTSRSWALGARGSNDKVLAWMTELRTLLSVATDSAVEMPQLTEQAVQHCYDTLYNADGNDSYEIEHKDLIRAHWKSLMEALNAAPPAPAVIDGWVGTHPDHSAQFLANADTDGHHLDMMTANGWTFRPVCYAFGQPTAALPGGLHPAVVAFAKAMQHKLDVNQHKDGAGWDRDPEGRRAGWAGCSVLFLLSKLDEEADELIGEFGTERDIEAIRNEAADVGNIAMMLADVSGALDYDDTPAPAVDEQAEDTARLDFLDKMNSALNAHYGTTYRWTLIQSPHITRLTAGPHNQGFVGWLDLNDADGSKDGVPSCREAIDAARLRAQQQDSEPSGVEAEGLADDGQTITDQQRETASAINAACRAQQQGGGQS